jgi:hypothetical protein
MIRAELGDLVTGRLCGWSRGDEITIFDSSGTGIQDVAAAARAFQVLNFATFPTGSTHARAREGSPGRSRDVLSFTFEPWSSGWDAGRPGLIQNNSGLPKDLGSPP